MGVALRESVAGLNSWVGLRLSPSPGLSSTLTPHFSSHSSEVPLSLPSLDAPRLVPPRGMVAFLVAPPPIFLIFWARTVRLMLYPLPVAYVCVHMYDTFMCRHLSAA